MYIMILRIYIIMQCYRLKLYSLHVQMNHEILKKIDYNDNVIFYIRICRQNNPVCTNISH